MFVPPRRGGELNRRIKTKFNYVDRGDFDLRVEDFLEGILSPDLGWN
jgi:hypothetical protein